MDVRDEEEARALSALAKVLSSEAHRRGVSPADMAMVVVSDVIRRADTRGRRGGLARRALPVVIGLACLVCVVPLVRSHHGVAASGSCAPSVTPVYDGTSGMISFCPDQPAVANEVNHNFAQVLTYLQQKVGPVGSADIATNGSINSQGSGSIGGDLTVTGAVNAASLNIAGVGLGDQIRNYVRTNCRIYIGWRANCWPNCNLSSPTAFASTTAGGVCSDEETLPSESANDGCATPVGLGTWAYATTIGSNSDTGSGAMYVRFQCD